MPYHKFSCSSCGDFLFKRYDPELKRDNKVTALCEYCSKSLEHQSSPNNSSLLTKSIDRSTFNIGSNSSIKTY